MEWWQVVLVFLSGYFTCLVAFALGSAATLGKRWINGEHAALACRSCGSQHLVVVPDEAATANPKGETV